MCTVGSDLTRVDGEADIQSHVQAFEPIFLWLALLSAAALHFNVHVQVPSDINLGLVNTTVVSRIPDFASVVHSFVLQYEHSFTPVIL